MTLKTGLITALALCICVGIAIAPVAALAQSVTGIASKAKGKVDDIMQIVTIVGGGLVGVGVVAGGIMMSMGSPDAWQYMSKVIIGGIIVAAGGQIAKWIVS